LRGRALGRPPLEPALMHAAHGVYAWLAVLALVGVTVLTRSFFLLPDREPRLPGWLRQGLRHAPVAALLAMVVPEVFLSNGHLLADWRDARLFAVAAALLYYLARRNDVTGTILAGAATLMLFRLGLGWP
ncbi:MAG: AzlD domain-containing protein, partial [Variovorax sp.]